MVQYLTIYILIRSSASSALFFIAVSSLLFRALSVFILALSWTEFMSTVGFQSRFQQYRSLFLPHQRFPPISCTWSRIPWRSFSPFLDPSPSSPSLPYHAAFSCEYQFHLWFLIFDLSTYIFRSNCSSKLFVFSARAAVRPSRRVFYNIFIFNSDPHFETTQLSLRSRGAGSKSVLPQADSLSPGYLSLSRTSCQLDVRQYRPNNFSPTTKHSHYPNSQSGCVCSNIESRLFTVDANHALDSSFDGRNNWNILTVSSNCLLASANFTPRVLISFSKICRCFSISIVHRSSVWRTWWEWIIVTRSESTELIRRILLCNRRTVKHNSRKHY